MDGNNGKWFDDGNHADEYNNPVKYKAVFEFETLNECKPLTDDGVQELTGRFCNTKIWDSTIDTVTVGQTLDCQTDKYGNEYCPSALSQCGQEWDYDSGFSVAGVGQTIDYSKKEEKQEITYKYTQCYGYPMINGKKDKAHYKGSPGTSVWYVNASGQTMSTDWGNWGQNCEFPLRKYVGNKLVFAKYLSDGECDYGGWQNSVYICNQSEQKPINSGTVATCPTGYTETTSSETSKGECKKTIEYTYYNYLCNNSKNEQGYNYTPINSGGNCNKIDSNNTTANPELTNPCNNSTPPTNNCKREKFMCQANKDRPCSFVDNSWQCSPFPCLGQSNLESLDTQVGKDDKNNDGWSEDGSCAGTIYIFNGKSNKCRSWDMFFGLTGGGCCDKEKVFAGLVACKENEKILAKKREEKQTHYIGNFCSKELKLGFTKICVQKSDSYCAFNSSLARIIQEQGREQLDISWGSAKSPECRGFTPEEFQKIDFSKIDLTEFVKDIQSSVQSSVIQNLGTYVKDKVGDFYGN
ncbi:conjugal transfer protein TraN [Arcobacter lanthieri]|nr:conjugal transfer protein TraN [Aliarcobacter lanthieri]